MHPISGRDGTPGCSWTSTDPPFWIIVFSELSGDSREPLAPIARRSLIELTTDRFDAEMERLGVGLRLTVPNTVGGADGGMMAIELKFSSMRDFAAPALIDQIPVLRSLEETRSRLIWLQNEMTNDSPLAAIIELLLMYNLLPMASMDEWAVSILTEHLNRLQGISSDRNAAPENLGHELLGRLGQRLSFVEAGELALAVGMAGDYARLTWCLGAMSEFVLKERFQGTASRDALAAALTAEVSRADQVITGTIGRQLDVIFHHPRFRRLEGAWRGLHYLATCAGTRGRVRLSSFNLSRRELASMCRHDLLERVMWQRMRRVWGRHPTIDLHDDAHWPDMPLVGREPIGLLVGDYSFDTESPDDFDMLRRIAGLARDLQAPAVVNYNDRGAESRSDQNRRSALPTLGAAQYVTLAAPAFLARLPHDAPADAQPDVFAYREQIASNEDLCWSGAALALAAKVAMAVHSGSWSTPTPSAAQNDAGREVWFVGQPKDRISEATARHHGIAVLEQALSCTAPVFITAPMAKAAGCVAEDLSLPDMLLACRMAHCLRLVARECAASDAGELQAILQSWIDQQEAGSSATLFAQPRPVKVLVRVEPPSELPRHAKGVLRHPQYFRGTLDLVLADGEGGRQYSMALRVNLYRRISSGSGRSGSGRRP